MNRAIVENVRCMLFDTKLSAKFSAEAVNTATYLINHIPISQTKHTPQEIWTGKHPNVSHLRVFGSIALAHVPKENRRKLDPRSTPCIFVGYEADRKAYRVFNPATNGIINPNNLVQTRSKYDKSIH